MVNLGNDWDEILKDEFQKDYYRNLRKFLADEYRKCVVYTGGAYFCIIFAIYCDLISSFRMTSSKEVAA